MSVMTDKLERGAADSLGATLNQQIEMSKAISLKRIADRLDHMTDYFDEGKAQLRVGANCEVRQTGSF